jgi:predicted MFS family arabinose efflux permease
VTPSAHRPGEAGYRRLVVALFLAGFAVFAQNYDAQALLPQLVREFGVSPATAALTVSATTLGIAVAVLPWSFVADRLGRVLTLKISITTAALIGMLTPLAPTFEVLVATRFVLGVALAALPAIAMAYIAEEIETAHVTATASVFVAGNAIGGLIGRLLAGFLGEQFGWHVGLAAVSALTIASGMAFLFVVPPPRGFVPAPLSLRVVAGRLAANLRKPALRALLVQGLLVLGATTTMYNYVGFRLQAEPLGVSAHLTNLAFLVYALGATATAVSGRIAGRIGRRRVLLVGLAAVGAGASLTLVDSVGWVLAGLAIFTVGSFSSHAIAAGLVGQVTDEGRAQATALYQLASQIGAGVLGWLAGLAFGGVGWVGVVVSLVASALVAAIALRSLGRV